MRLSFVNELKNVGEDVGFPFVNPTYEGGDRTMLCVAITDRAKSP
jgi:hypothetical protein